MKKFLLIGNNTLPRRYLINRLLDAGLPLAGCVFESVGVKAPFATGPAYEDKERAYLQRAFFTQVREDLDRVSCWSFDNANTPQALEKFAELGAELALVSGAGLLRRPVLAAFPQGLMNLHLGTAETYRGLDTNQWAIYHREWDQIGVTLHWVSEDLDTGDIITQMPVPLHKGMKCHELRYYEMALAADIAIEALTQWLSGSVTSRPQTQRGRYYSFMPRDLRLLVEKRFNCHYAKFGD